jgi:hypothetical protein
MKILKIKKHLLKCLLITLSISTYSQQLPNRYIENITQNVQVTKNIIFSTNIPTVRTTNLFGNHIANEDSFGKKKVTLKMDIYRPSGDTLTKRPVIIFAFGGAFINGKKSNKGMVKLCEEFARRGFVTASIEYRLGMNITDQELSRRAVYRALQDGRSAVRFFRKNAATYGIDPDQVYISGQSSGAILSLHSVYLDKESDRPVSTRDYFGRPDLGGIESIGDNKTYNNGSVVNGKANGVMAFAGALGEIDYIENANDVKAIYFHSTDDNIILYDSGEPFKNFNWIPGFNLPTLYGSKPLSIRSSNVNLTNVLHTYSNRGHAVHLDGNSIYPDITPKGSQYFYDNFLKPNNVTISGNNLGCSNCIETYSVPNNSFYYDWEVIGGSIINQSPYSNNVTIQWNSTSTKQITVTNYSRQLARGNVTSLVINNQLKNFVQPVVTISPNPFKENLNIELNEAFNGEIRIAIFNINGEEVLNTHSTKNNPTIIESINTSNLIAGYYFIKIIDEKNSVVKKLIKQ